MGRQLSKPPKLPVPKGTWIRRLGGPRPVAAAMLNMPTCQLILTERRRTGRATSSLPELGGPRFVAAGFRPDRFPPVW